MLMLLLGSLIGIVTGLLIDFYLLIALCFLSMMLFFTVKKRWSAKYPSIISFRSMSIFLICLIIFYLVTNRLVYQYDTKYQDGEMNGQLKILSYADEGDYYDKYLCKNTKGDKFLVYFPHHTSWKKGDVVNVNGELTLPDLARNEGGFHYRRYLNSQKIFGSIFVKDYALVDTAKFNLIYYIQDEIHRSFSQLFPKNEMGLILGMMIGETKDISEDVLQSFKDTGITHLVAVSGSNVMYVLICVQFLFRKFFGKRGTHYISIVFLIIFMFLSGASSSVIRATIMTTFMLVADLVYQKSDVMNNIYMAAFILMVLNPLVVYDVGFILSFGGTLGIVLLSKDFEKLFQKFGKLSETLAVTCSAQLMLMPIMAYYFNTFSLLSVVTNLIVVPISGFITILGFAVFLLSKLCFPLASFLSQSLYMLAHFTIFISQLFSQIPFSNIQVITPNFLEMMIFYFILFYLLGKMDFVVSSDAQQKATSRKVYQ